MSLFDIRARGSDQPAEIFIYGDIGDSWAEESVTAAQFVRDLAAIDAPALNVRINSYGGAVSDALAIYNALQRHRATVNTFVDGVAISAASLIAMAGETVSMAENALLMVHGPSALAAGNADTMREAADLLDKFSAAMAPSYAAKTGKPVRDMLALLTDGEDHWYTATEAQAAGFADEIAPAVAVGASFGPCRYRSAPAAAAAFFKGLDMPDGTQPAATGTSNAAANQGSLPLAGVPAQPAAQAAQPAAVLAAVLGPSGRTREANVEIRDAFAPFMQHEGVRAEYDAILLDPSITVEAARARLLTALGRGQTPGNPAASFVQMGENETDKFRAACTEAILFRANVLGRDEQARIRASIGQNPYRGHKLLDIARASLARIGQRVDGLDQMHIVAAAFTQGTSDFPVLLENTMHKALLGAYATQAATWSRFCARGTVSDFRAHNRYRRGTFGTLDSVNELGEFKNKAIPDGQKSSITAATKGNIINLSRQAVINDDLGAFVGLAADLGGAAARTVDADVFAMLAENSGAGPTMADGGILFNSTVSSTAGGHANRAAYATPTVALLDAGRTAMRVQQAGTAAQITAGQSDYLALSPAVALVPASLYGTMNVLNGAVYDPDTANKLQKPNMVAGMVNDVVDSPRITWSAWYLFADPAIAPVFEVAFLDGNDQPYLEMQNGFEVDGARYKVRLDYGTGVRDYVGGYASVGA